MTELLEQIKTVNQKKERIQKQIDELKEAGEDVWEDIKDKVEDAQREVHDLIHKIFPKKEEQSTDVKNEPEE